MPVVVRTITNPKLDLAAEIHRHDLVNPPANTPRVRFFATVNGERPAASEMRLTEDEAAQDGATAIGLPRDYIAGLTAAAAPAPSADAGAANSPA